MEAYLWKLVARLPDDAPIFGPITLGRVQAPRESVGRKNAVSWRTVVKAIADERKYLRPLAHDECWMTLSPQISLTFTDPTSGKTTVARRILVVRFLAYLKEPSARNYELLDGGNLDMPFDHRCQRGQPTDPLQKGRVCVNGIAHGSFESRATNESRKQCKNGACCLCPGHGPNKTKCVYTSPTGKLAPCRNCDTFVPQCRCDPPCY